MESLGICVTGFNLACTALFKTRAPADGLAILCIVLFVLFGGHYMSLNEVPVYCQWIEYIGFVSYASQAAIANEYRELSFTDDYQEMDAANCTSNVVSGEEILYSRGMDDVDIGFSI